MSRIITFYSYKGGVGRTLALANIGVLLAKLGKRVLLMDWDLEAPGLDRYFQPYLENGFASDRGIVHLLHQAAENPACDWRSHVQEVTVRAENTSADASYRLSIIPSGVASTDYGLKVRSFSWSTFMEENDGGPILERWRDEWKKDFDFILIDSRTGITDTGGICTVLLPDLLVLVFTANDQSFEGALAISQSAQVERRNLAVQRPPLTILPLLSRFDGRKETDLAEQWLKRFDIELRPIFDNWLPKHFKPRQMIELIKIPYVTRFSFGEPLPVLTHSLTDPEFPGFFLENATRLLASDFKDAAQIIDPESTIAPDTSAQIRSLISRVPLDEMDLSRLLRIAEQELGESPELASLLNDIWQALYRQARWQSAEPLIRKALVTDEQNFGPDHPTVAIRLNNLAQLLHQTNRLAEAEPLIRRALAIDEQSYGAEHPTVAIRLNNLATLLVDKNRLAEAEPLLRRALAIDEQSYGLEHPTVATDLNNLAQLLQDTNRLAEAEPLMRRALAIDEQSYGLEHPTVAIRLNNLAQLLQKTDRLAEAEPLMRRALEIFSESSHRGGHDEPRLRTVARNYKILLEKIGMK